MRKIVFRRSPIMKGEHYIWDSVDEAVNRGGIPKDQIHHWSTWRDRKFGDWLECDSGHVVEFVRIHYFPSYYTITDEKKKLGAVQIVTAAKTITASKKYFDLINLPVFYSQDSRNDVPKNQNSLKRKVFAALCIHYGFDYVKSWREAFPDQDRNITGFNKKMIRAKRMFELPIVQETIKNMLREKIKDRKIDDSLLDVYEAHLSRMKKTAKQTPPTKEDNIMTGQIKDLVISIEEKPIIPKPGYIGSGNVEDAITAPIETPRLTEKIETPKVEVKIAEQVTTKK